MSQTYLICIRDNFRTCFSSAFYDVSVAVLPLKHVISKRGQRISSISVAVLSLNSEYLNLRVRGSGILKFLKVVLKNEKKFQPESNVVKILDFFGNVLKN